MTRPSAAPQGAKHSRSGAATSLARRAPLEAEIACRTGAWQAPAPRPRPERSGRAGHTRHMNDIVHNTSASRFETRVDGLLCVADYRVRGDIMIMPHTEVPAALRGHGIAAALVAAALDWARAHKLKVDPRCSYVASYMRRHSETQDLMAA